MQQQQRVAPKQAMRQQSSCCCCFFASLALCSAAASVYLEGINLLLNDMFCDQTEFFKVFKENTMPCS